MNDLKLTITIKYFINLFKGKVKLSLCFNLAPHHEGILGSGDIASSMHL